MIFYGLTTSIQDLGLKNVTENGIFLGVTQTIGYFICLPFAHKMKRKTWSIIFQIICLLGAIGLAYLSKINDNDSDLIGFLETIISTCVLATINSAQFPILFAYISELYPTKMRGLANAIILFTGKLFGALAPFMENIGLEYGYHVLVGCSSFLVFSLPLSFFIKETMTGKGDGEENDEIIEGVISIEKKSEVHQEGEMNNRDEYIKLD